MNIDEYLKSEMTKDFKSIMEKERDPEYLEKKRIEQRRKERLYNELL